MEPRSIRALLEAGASHPDLVTLAGASQRKRCRRSNGIWRVPNSPPSLRLPRTSLVQATFSPSEIPSVGPTGGVLTYANVAGG